MTVSEHVSEFTVMLGKGPGYVLVAMIEVGIAAIVAHFGKDLTGLSLVYGAINVPFYGSGVWKAVSDNKAASGKPNEP